MLSFFTIQAYRQKTKESEVKDGATLTNQLLYPNEFENSIFDAVNRLSQADKGNFFLESFVTMVPMFAETNITGMNLLQANTWRGLDKEQKVDLQTSFTKLYGNPLLRKDAMTIVNYIMVKDGLQAAKGSLLDAISPFVMDEYLQQINNVNDVFLTNKGWLETFGAERNDLVDYFENGYFKSASTNSKVKTITVGDPLDINSRYTSKEGNVVYTMDKDGDPDALPRYINFADAITGFSQLYVLDNIDKKKANYKLSQMEGSYYQNGIGFMFGERPTTLENRDNIRNKGEMKSAYGAESFGAMTVEQMAPPVNSPQNQALANENATIEATEDEINFTAEDSQKAINISDTGLLDSILKSDEQAEENVETEATGIVDAQENMPVETEERQQLTFDFDTEISDKYPVISSFYNSIFTVPGVGGDIVAYRDILENNNLDSLEGMVDFYNSPNTEFKSEEAFEDYVKKCILGI